MRSPGDLRGSAKQQTKLIERFTGDENESEESPRVLLRLLIDEIVDALSQSGEGHNLDISVNCPA